MSFVILFCGTRLNMGQDNSRQQSTSLAAMKKGSYYYKPNVREMYPQGGVSKQPNDIRTLKLWQEANAKARLNAQPRKGPYSQFDAPIVSHLDPHQMKQNPLDPFQDNVLFTLTTFKNRNTNFDPRGQPQLPSGWQSQQGDSLIQIRNVERLAYHGPSHQIGGCVEPRPPKY